MEHQERLYSCGPAAIRAALYMLGRKVREATIRKVAGTTTDGTDEKGIIKAIRHYGYKTTEFSTISRRQAWSRIKLNIKKGRPMILCVNGWQHWVVVIGSFGGKVMVFDPYKVPGKQKSYSGIKPMNEKDLLKIWGYSDSDVTEETFYGIVVRN